MKAHLDEQKADLEPLLFYGWDNVPLVIVVCRQCGNDEVAKVGELVRADKDDLTVHAPVILSRDGGRLGAVMYVQALDREIAATIRRQGQRAMDAAAGQEWLLLDRLPPCGLPRMLPTWCPTCGVALIDSGEVMVALAAARRTGKVRKVRTMRSAPTHGARLVT